MPAHAQEGVSVHNGFVEGSEYKAMSPQAQVAYAMGIIDGMLVAPLLGAPDRGKAWRLGECMTGMRDDQVATILQKYLDEHPEEWHYGMHAVAFRAFVSICEVQ